MALCLVNETAQSQYFPLCSLFQSPPCLYFHIINTCRMFQTVMLFSNLTLCVESRHSASSSSATSHNQMLVAFSHCCLMHQVKWHYLFTYMLSVSVTNIWIHILRRQIISVWVNTQKTNMFFIFFFFKHIHSLVNLCKKLNINEQLMNLEDMQ